MLTEKSTLLIQKPESSSTVKVVCEKISIAGEDSYIFGVLESGHPGQDLLLDHALNQIINNFPTNKIKKNKLSEIFEEVLQNANQNLTDYIKEKNILVDFDNFNGAIAILCGKDLHFSYMGKIITFLIHKIGKDNFKVIDILDSISGSAVKPTVFKIFSNVISGEIQDEDSVFFSTANILNYTDTDKLKELVVSCQTTTAIDELKNILEKAKQDVSFGSVLLKLNPKRIASIAKCDEAVDELVEEAEEKESVLSKMLTRTRKHENTKLVLSHVEGTRKQIPESVSPIVEQVESPVINVDNKITDEEVQTTKQPSKVAEKISEQINQTKNKFLSWKRVSQFLFIAILVLAIFFVQGLKNKSQQNLAIQQEKDYTQNIQNIETKLTQIKAKLIIDEKDDAAILINEVETLIAQLPESQKATELTNETEKYLNQIRNITQIDNPTVIAELANPATKLIKQKDTIYLYNSNNSLYRLDLNSNEVKVVATGIEDKGAWQKNAPEVEQGKTLLLYNGSGLSQYDFTANELEVVQIELADNIKIDDLNFYGQKLYLVDGTNNKIYKHIKLTKNSFNSGSSWLLDDTDLSGAVSIAIDGNIWVLKKSGEIIKLFKNKKVDFKLKTIDPPLNNPTKLYTTLEMDNIYILEPAGKRLVVIDKLGNLLGQYYSPQFDDLLDFVLEKDKDGKESGKVYLLNGLKVLEITTE